MLGKQVRWNGFARPYLPSSLTLSHVSLENECLQPHGRQSRADQATSGEVVREVGVEVILRHRCLVAFCGTNGPHLMPAGRNRRSTCESAIEHMYTGYETYTIRPNSRNGFAFAFEHIVLPRIHRHATLMLTKPYHHL